MGWDMGMGRVLLAAHCKSIFIPIILWLRVQSREDVVRKRVCLAVLLGVFQGGGSVDRSAAGVRTLEDAKRRFDGGGSVFEAVGRGLAAQALCEFDGHGMVWDVPIDLNLGLNLILGRPKGTPETGKRKRFDHGITRCRC